MTLAPRQEDPTVRIRRRQQEMDFYPTGSSWKEFVASLGKTVRPFALVVERQVRHNEHFFSLRRDDHGPQEIFFGIKINRKDGRLGTLCFGRVTKEFGGEGKRAPSGKFLAIEALDPTFLRTWGAENDEMTYSSPMDHKVVEVITEPERFDEKLAEFISTFIPERKVPGKQKSRELIVMRDRLELFFAAVGFRSYPIFPKTEEVITRFNDCLAARRSWLSSRNQKLKAAAKANDEEWKLLGAV